jgi:predicted Zn finger-like uncharacterized protein
MQVTCPNCAARYAVDPLAIGPTGRTVQCARCHDRWFQTVERERAVPDLVIRPPGPGASHAISLPAVIAPSTRDGWWGTVLAAAVVLVTVLAVAAFAFRDEIMTWLPGEWRQVLQSTGSPAGPPAPTIPALLAAQPTGAQLEIDLAASKVDTVDGRYVVRGEIVNTGRVAGSTRLLKVIFKNQDEVLGGRDVPMVAGPIAPGDRLSFTLPLDEPPTGSTGVSFTIE